LILLLEHEDAELLVPGELDKEPTAATRRSYLLRRQTTVLRRVVKVKIPPRPLPPRRPGNIGHDDMVITSGGRAGSKFEAEIELIDRGGEVGAWNRSSFCDTLRRAKVSRLDLNVADSEVRGLPFRQLLPLANNGCWIGLLEDISMSSSTSMQELKSLTPPSPPLSRC
jgi:hypothetical protein